MAVGEPGRARVGAHYPGGLDALFGARDERQGPVAGHARHRVRRTHRAVSAQPVQRADLARLVKAAYDYPLIRELSTSPEHAVEVRNRTLQFHNTNGLVRNPSWDIGLQKTGYIAEAGRCLVMQAQLAGRKLILVFLDSAGKYSRIGDAERVRIGSRRALPPAG
jgi:D-alanyl-D-alanine endopeptidase (penicillin-binding protein 7)